TRTTTSSCSGSWAKSCIRCRASCRPCAPRGKPPSSWRRWGRSSWAGPLCGTPRPSRGDGLIRGLVFDLDGTLIDSRTDIARAANHALARHGFPELPESTIALYVGDGARTLMARAAALAPEDPRLTPLHAEFLRYYTAHPVVSTRVIPGAARAL